MQYNIKSDTRSLYIHWPFCPYKCNFCPFVAIASHDQFMEQYHNALKKEIQSYAASFSDYSIDTVFFGGGTPSTYPDALLLDTFDTLSKSFNFHVGTEVSIEVNPGTVRTEQLQIWKDAGINRISIGVQSLKDAVLQKLNRHQTAEQVFSLLDRASKVFDNISIDLILGLPEVTPDEWKDLLKRVVTWPIKHVSVYFLTVHEDTPLYFKVKTQRISLPHDDEMVDLYQWTRLFLAENGFEQYELSNFGKAGFESKHNTVYWDRKPYKGLGLGACSFDGSSRFQNDKNLMRYIEGVEKGKDITAFCETLSREQVHLERLMLGLRRKKGVVWDDAIELISVSKRQEFKDSIDQFMQQGLLVKEGETIRLTPQGLVVENEIISQLI